LEAFYNENFAVGSSLDRSNIPTYEYFQNFEQYLVMMEKSDWKKNV
jgi:hypothetical protein